MSPGPLGLLRSFGMGGVPAPPPPFAPTDLGGLALWLDADDATTITAASGAVSEWRDKSGNASHMAQGTSSLQPTTGAHTINGRNAVSFDGGDSLSRAAFNLVTASGLTIFAVVTCVSGGDRVLLEHTTDYNTASGAFIAFRTNVNAMRLGRRVPGSPAVYSTFNTTGTLTTTPRLLTATYNLAATTDEWNAGFDGVFAGTRPANNNLTAAFVTDTLFLGSRAGSALFWSGLVAELLIYDRPLGSSDVDAVEGHLAGRWGVVL